MDWHAREAFLTLPDVFAAGVAQAPQPACMSWREAGYWRHWSSETVAEQVRRLALGLHHLGVRRGDAVGLLGPSSPTWVVADLAVMSLGAVTVPMFATLCAEHLAHELKSTAQRAVIVLGAEAWAALQPHLSLIPSAHAIVKGVPGLRHRHTCTWNDALDHGDRVAAQDPTLFPRLRAAVEPDDVATIIHTSGSTGLPKGVVLTHANVVSQVRGACALFPLTPGVDRALTCLPLPHVFERVVLFSYLAQGIGVWFADDVKNVGTLLREVHPTVVTVVPRLLEKIHASIAAKIAAGWAMKRGVGQWAFSLAEREDPAQPTRAHAVADKLLYAQLRSALGGNLRYLIVGGAPLADTLARFLVNIGVPLFAGYGLTEASPVIAVNAPGRRKLGTVGRLFPGVAVRFTDAGEILASGPGIMRGYYRDPIATAVAIDTDGWLHTGDLGALDADGYLTITGRVKELLKTSNGKYVSPVPLEQELMSSGLFDQTLVLADGRPCAAALLFIEPAQLTTLKRQLNVTGDDAEFLRSPLLAARIQPLIDGANAVTDPWSRIRAWRAVSVALSIADGDLTPTMKIRRAVVSARFATDIDAMYRELAANGPKESP